MIFFDGLTKRVGGRRIVEAVSFRALPGEVTALVGPAGSGKSVLLRCLGGLVAPTQGTALVHGQKVSDLPLPGRTIGFALDSDSLHPGRTVRETLLLAVMASRMPSTRAAELVRSHGLDEDQRVADLDADQRQRLLLAVAMAGQPHALVVDDALERLDEQSKPWFEAVVRDFTRHGGTVLMTAHEPAQVSGLADAVVTIADGTTIATRQCEGSGAQRDASRTRAATDDANDSELDGGATQTLRTGLADAVQLLLGRPGRTQTRQLVATAGRR